MPEWLMGTGCKPVGYVLRWFKSSSAQTILKDTKKKAFFSIFANQKMLWKSQILTHFKKNDVSLLFTEPVVGKGVKKLWGWHLKSDIAKSDVKGDLRC